MVAHPGYIAVALSGFGFALLVVGVLTALKPASRLARHAGALADDPMFLQIASLQMQFERLTHVGSEVAPLAARARNAVVAMQRDLADWGLADIARGLHASNRAIGQMIDTFR